MIKKATYLGDQTLIFLKKTVTCDLSQRVGLTRFYLIFQFIFLLSTDEDYSILTEYVM